jgi:hypothetical protein
MGIHSSGVIFALIGRSFFVSVSSIDLRATFSDRAAITHENSPTDNILNKCGHAGFDAQHARAKNEETNHD